MTSATPKLVDNIEAQVLADLVAAEKELVKAEAKAATSWVAFQGALDRAFGEKQPALLVSESPPIAAGRFTQERGAGVDPELLAKRLKAILKPAEYKKLVTEDKTVTMTYHINEAAVQQAADEHEEVAQAVTQSTIQGKPVLVRVKPRAASADEVKTAIAAARSAVQERKLA